MRVVVGALVLGFLLTTDLPMIGGPPHLTKVLAIVSMALNAPYYLLAARFPTSLRTQAYGRLIVDILFITVGLYSAGGLAAAPYLSVYGVIPVYVGIALSGPGCIVATAVSTVAYVALASAQQLGWLDLEPLPSIAWVGAVFNLVILNVVGALTAFLAGAYRRSRDRIRESEERYRTLFEQAPVGVYRATPDGRLVVANPALVRMLGYDSVDELVGQPLPRATAEPADVGGVIRGADVEWKRKDGSLLFVREHCEPIHDAAGGALRYYEGTIEDVTERKALEEQLRQSQKLDAIGRLAGGVAHDFNNLLTAIVGYAELIPQRAADPAFVRYGAQEISQAAAHASALTRQLLAFSRGQSTEPVVLDVNRIVAKMEQMVRRLIGEDIELGIVADPKLARVKADAGQLEQVLLNLVVNARDAMPHGGRLTIETADVAMDAREAHRHGVSPGRYVVLSASDTGIGMDAATRARIFEPFFTTKSVDKGTGLGLSTVYGIVKQAGGMVSVDSEPGHGTTFRIYLPAVDADPTAPAPAAPPVVPGGAETILLVEDDERVRVFIRDSLLASGYKVLVARDGVDALAVAAAWDGPIDLMVTDFVMPHMSGRDVARHFAALRPAMKVLFISGYTARQSPGESEAGLDHFLSKPFGPDTLARKVREVFDGVPALP